MRREFASLRGVHIGADPHFVAGGAVSASAHFQGPDLHAGGRRRDQCRPNDASQVTTEAVSNCREQRL